MRACPRPRRADRKASAASATLQGRLRRRAATLRGVTAALTPTGQAGHGRPVVRPFDTGWTAEVTRLATDGTPNACGCLYGAAWRTARAAGYERIITYTQHGESGASLRSAGWHLAPPCCARAPADHRHHRPARARRTRRLTARARERRGRREPPRRVGCGGCCRTGCCSSTPAAPAADIRAWSRLSHAWSIPEWRPRSWSPPMGGR
ncbi:XF1762 family protein [Streptomyces sp. NPDC020917]|uniref:XF1762 family protein n=1 Tax=Streptomyces sp. NPDC020917 TaxID=3365102 RepID=UPI00379549F9